MKRRLFLKATTLAAASTYFSNSIIGQLAYAAGQSQFAPKLVVIRVNGAMDCIAGLNPWVGARPPASDLFIPYEPNEVLQNILGTQIHLAPAAQSLAEFAASMAIVNGIWMGVDDFGHPTAMQYMTSGHTQEKAPHLSAIIANQRSDKKDFLLINGSVEKRDLKIRLQQSINLYNGLKVDASGISKMLEVYKSRNQHLANFLALSKDTDLSARFNSVYEQIKSKESKPTSQEGSIDDEVAVAALASGLSSVVQLDWENRGNLDSHIRYIDDHQAQVKIRFDRLAVFLKNLKKFGIFEKTLVVVITEFSRTPALNGNLGKDHNYLDSSALFIGYGINGGRVVGSHRVFGAESDKDMSQISGDFIDYGSNGRDGTGEIFRTNEKPQNAESAIIPDTVDLIRPSNVVATAAEIILPGSSKLLGEKALVLPKIIK